MTARRGVLALLALVAVTGCGQGGGAPGAPGSTASSPPSPEASTSPAASTPAGELPGVVATPDSGPPGTIVTVEGEGFTDPMWQQLNGWDEPGGHREYFGLNAMLQNEDCDLVVEDEYVRSSVTADGHFSAAFRVGRTGSCFQTFRERAVPPGDYSIHFLCHVCDVGTFRVTGAS